MDFYLSENTVPEFYRCKQAVDSGNEQGLKRLWHGLQWFVGRKVCGAPAEQELGSNFMRMDRDIYVPDLIAASDCMLGTFFHWRYAYRATFVSCLFLLVEVFFADLSVSGSETNLELWLLQARLVMEPLVKRWLLRHLLCLFDEITSMKSRF